MGHRLLNPDTLATGRCRTTDRTSGSAGASPPDEREPLVLMLALTNACNLSCRHCYRHQSVAFGDELKPAEIFGVLEQFAELCEREDHRGAVVFSGGEPLLHPHLGLAIRVARSLGLHARVNTSATLATPAVAEALAGWGLEVAQVSLDGADRVTHEAVRGPHTWEPARRGISAFQAAGITVELKVTLIRDRNDADPVAFMRLARHWDVSIVSFARLIAIGSGSGFPAHDAASWRAVLEALARERVAGVIGDIRDFTFDRSFLLGAPHRLGPEEAFHVLAVDADGTCLVSRRLPIPLGNIRFEPLARMWHHPLLERMRGEQSTGKCQRCDLRELCRGGSRAAAWGGSEGLNLAPDPACWVEVP